MLEILFYSFLIMLASLSGVFFVWKKLGKVIDENLGFLVSFSAGVFLVVAYQLGKETILHGDSVLRGIFWIATGALLVWLLFKLLPDFHHHHNKKHNCCKNHRLDPRRILFSDGIHNIGDGLLLAAAFSIASSLGVITALSIFIHEVVQEISEFFVLKQAGFSTAKALILNFLVSGTILVGALVGFFLLKNYEVLEIPLLGLAAGSFLVVVFHDLIPHSAEVSRKNNCFWQHLSWFLIGLVLMFSINQFFTHSHEHEHEHDQHEEAVGYHGYYGIIETE
jgi:zinc and cadmium transporter